MESHWFDPLLNNPADTPISLEKAVMIFDQLADSDKICFILIDGCSARTHIMGRQVFEMGITPKKAWAFEGEKFTEELNIKIAGQDIRWWFHVALAIPVIQPDGAIIDMVFDPGIFDGPVTLEKWADTINTPPDRREIRPFADLPPQYTDDVDPTRFRLSENSDSNALSTMKTLFDIRSTGPRRYVFASDARRTVTPYADGDLPAGKTWISIPEGTHDRVIPAPPKENTAPRL